MPVVAMAIEMDIPFHDAVEKVSNVYTLDSGVDIFDDWSGVATDIANIQASVCANDQTITAYRVWNLEGTSLDRVIIDAGDLEIPGVRTPDSTYRECAILVRWPLSRSPVLRRRRWLSKWLHTGYSGGTFGGTTGETKLPAAFLAEVKEQYVDAIRDYGSSDPTSVQFTDATGERPGEGFVKEYLEHRQFHRGS